MTKNKKGAWQRDSNGHSSSIPCKKVHRNGIIYILHHCIVEFVKKAKQEEIIAALLELIYPSHFNSFILY